MANLKKLYMAKNLEELNSKINNIDLNKKNVNIILTIYLTIKMARKQISSDIIATMIDDFNLSDFRRNHKLLKSAEKLFAAAENSDQGKDKDEESAYLLFMRYFRIIQKIQETSDYVSNEKYFKNVLDSKRVKKALIRTEELSNSLTARYKPLEEKKNSELSARKKESNEKEKKELLNDDAKNFANKTSLEDGFIEPKHLFSLTKERVSSFLILDIRDTTDFKKSSMKISTLINIPSDVLKPGLTANKIHRGLSDDLKDLWSERDKFDYIIICDWDSESKPFSAHITTLLDAMLKWDPEKKYRTKPVILKGGYEMFALKYPHMITNPLDQHERFKSSKNNIDDTLSSLSFSYPNLNFEATKPKLIETPETTPLLIPQVTKKPIIDRNSKPMNFPSTTLTQEVANNNFMNQNLAGFNNQGKNFISQNQNGFNQGQNQTAFYNREQNFISQNRTEVNNRAQSRIGKLNNIVSPKSRESFKPESEVESPVLQVDDPFNASVVIEEYGNQLPDGSFSGSKLSNYLYDSKDSFNSPINKSNETQKEHSSRIESNTSKVGDFIKNEKRGLSPIFSNESLPANKPATVPIVPDRSLKDRELLTNFDAKKKYLDGQDEILKQTIRAEKEALDKLLEIEQIIEQPLNPLLLNMPANGLTRVKQLEEELNRKINCANDLEKNNVNFQPVQREVDSIISQMFLESHQLNQDKNLKNIRHTELTKNADRNALLKEVELIRNKRKEKEEKVNSKLNRERKVDSSTDNKENQWDNTEYTEQTRGRSRNPVTYHTRLKNSPSSSPVRGTNLKRSHSALNLSRIKDLHSENNPRIATESVPKIDRSLKNLNLSSPRKRNFNVARQRNFEPKIGAVSVTKTGLKNLGNTCFMNSIIQCLSNTYLFAKYFFDGFYIDDINQLSVRKGESAEEFGAVIKALWSGQYRSISMWDLKAAIGRFHRPFYGRDQHDAHEFLIKLLDWLHEDLNVSKNKNRVLPEQNHDCIPDHEAAESVMEILKSRDDSVVRQLFYGLHRSVVICETCDNRSLTFEPFSVLTLSFTTSSKCTLNDMFRDFYKRSQIEYKCSKCDRFRLSTKKIDIWKLPPVLIIHLSRFEHSDVLTKKKQSYVDFPLYDLDLSDYIPSVSYKRGAYDLYAVSNHFGTMDGGHYTSYCRTPNRSSWSRFDDHEVYDLSTQSVKTAAAYILFYTDKELRNI